MDKNSSLIQLAESPEARFWRVGFDELTLAEQVFLAVWELEGEVNNGGFDQYFFNSSGDLAWFAPTALEAIGAAKAAEIVRHACAIFRGGKPSVDRDARQADLKAAGAEAQDRLELLDQAFFNYPDDLTTLVFDYVAAHRADIVGAIEDIRRQHFIDTQQESSTGVLSTRLTGAIFYYCDRSPRFLVGQSEVM